MHRLIHRIPSYFDTPDPSYLDKQIDSNEEPQEMKTQDRKLSMIANKEYSYVQRIFTMRDLH